MRLALPQALRSPCNSDCNFRLAPTAVSLARCMVPPLSICRNLLCSVRLFSSLFPFLSLGVTSFLISQFRIPGLSHLKIILLLRSLYLLQLRLLFSTPMLTVEFSKSPTIQACTLSRRNPSSSMVKSSSDLSWLSPSHTTIVSSTVGRLSLSSVRLRPLLTHRDLSVSSKLTWVMRL